MKSDYFHTLRWNESEPTDSVPVYRLIVFPQLSASLLLLSDLEKPPPAVWKPPRATAASTTGLKYRWATVVWPYSVKELSRSSDRCSNAICSRSAGALWQINHSLTRTRGAGNPKHFNLAKSKLFFCCFTRIKRTKWEPVPLVCLCCAFPSFSSEFWALPVTHRWWNRNFLKPSPSNRILLNNSALHSGTLYLQTQSINIPPSQTLLEKVLWLKLTADPHYQGRIPTRITLHTMDSLWASVVTRRAALHDLLLPTVPSTSRSFCEMLEQAQKNISRYMPRVDIDNYRDI